MLLFLLACVAVDTGEKDSAAPAPVDPDGDGFRAEDGDCDQGDAAVHPDAAEVCDGIDNDCDGLVDDADTLAPGAGDPWYVDADGDTFGSPDGTVTACDRPAGYTSDADDCDDTDETVWPGQVERCDGVDDDCDGLVDEAGASGEGTWYPDVDGDGFGADAAPVDACSAPDGYTDVPGDCDDDDAATYPHAPEDCDVVDRDCDGDPTFGAADPTAWHDDLDEDGYGDDLSFVYGCEAPGGTTATGGDCDDADAAVHPDAGERCDGVDEDCDGTADEDADDAATWFLDEDGDGAGGAAWGQACEAPAGTRASSTDCDDADATINPDAIEVCDGADNNCDGATDESGGETWWYPDVDGDGFGDDLTASTPCEPPVGALEVGGDCDDTRADVFPGAAEQCDHLDHNCSGDSLDETGAGYVDTTGAFTDIVAVLSAGIAGDPVFVGDQATYDLVVSEGAVHLCAGTWYLKVVTANVGTTLAVVGSGADVTTITTGGSPGSIVAVSNGTVTVDDLTITGGIGSSSSVGGGVVATQTSGGARPAAPNVTLTGVVVSGNNTEYGGGVAVHNYGWVSLVDTIVRENTASIEGGGAWIEDAGAVTCTGGGIYGNVAPDGGGVYLRSTTAGTVTGTGCDWGAGADDNSIYDVQIGASGWCWEGTEDVACTGGSCTASEGCP